MPRCGEMLLLGAEEGEEFYVSDAEGNIGGAWWWEGRGWWEMRLRGAQGK